jgi:hypothetical protein
MAQAGGDYGMATKVESVRDILVTVGLGSPVRRAAAVLGISLGLAYVARLPSGAFAEDGKIRPLQEATFQHFLVVPVALAAATFVLS